MPLIALILSPFTLIYYLISRFRNHLYNIGYKRSFSFETNVIAVGNLSVGGTGKSPMVEYIIRLLSKDNKLATLSRGYGRKTKGFRIANETDNASTLGDEPFQFYLKHKGQVKVTVGEERALAIPEILFEFPETDVILLDDAYQHRSVKPNLNILLTDYNKPLYSDFVLPSGRLREPRSGANRADIIVVTKCPTDLPESSMTEVTKYLSKYKRETTPVFFSAISYHTPRRVNESLLADWCSNVFLFAGIANPVPLEYYVKKEFNLLGTKYFKDHYDYMPKDIQQLKAQYDDLQEENKVILTTEKDMVKLLAEHLKPEITKIPIFYLPIESYFLKNGHIFDGIIKTKVEE